MFHRMSHEIRGVFFNALKVLNQSFVDRSAPDFFRKPADTDIACGIILNMFMYGRIVSPIFYAHLTHAHMLRSNSQLPFYPSTRVPILHSFTCKQAPDVGIGTCG